VYTLHVNAAGGGQEYSLHVHRRLLAALNSLCDVEKSSLNAGIVEKTLI
jgi:hypothetical protein